MSVDAVVDQALTNMLGKIAPAAQQQQARESRVVNVPFVFGVPATPAVAGAHLPIRLGLNGPATVVSWSLAATIGGVVSGGSCTVDVRAGLFLGTAASICGGSPPSLAGVGEVDDFVPVGWTPSISDPVWLVASLTSVDGLLEVIALTLRLSVATDPLVSIVGDSAGDVVVDNSGNPLTWT